MNSKGRRLALQKSGHVNTDINVTPLVDVVLVLLIIFMVVTPLLEKNIGVRTPASEKVEQPTEVPPDQIVIYLDAKGEARINSEQVVFAELVNKLKAMLGNRADKTVFVVADDRAPYPRFVGVLDSTREAGATTLGFATDKPEQSLFNN